MIKFKLDRFEGPLDLLLELIEAKKLEINQVSLAEVADQYLAFLENNPGLPAESIADFLVVASRLLLLKSMALLPSSDETEEAEEIEELAARLKEYQKYKQLAGKLTDIRKSGRVALTRPWQRQRAYFLPPADLDTGALARLYFSFLDKEADIFLNLESKSLPETVSISDKIDLIKAEIERAASFKFNKILSDNLTDKIVSFLAVLELSKQRVISLKQTNTFGEIFIIRRGDAR